MQLLRERYYLQSPRGRHPRRFRFCLTFICAVFMFTCTGPPGVALESQPREARETVLLRFGPQPNRVVESHQIARVSFRIDADPGPALAALWRPCGPPFPCSLVMVSEAEWTLITQRPDPGGSYEFEFSFDPKLTVKRGVETAVEFSPVEQALRGRPLSGTVDPAGALHLEALGPYSGPPELLRAFEELLVDFVSPSLLPRRLVWGEAARATGKRKIPLSDQLSLPAAVTFDYELVAVDGRDVVIRQHVRESGSKTVGDVHFAVDVTGHGELRYDRGHDIQEFNRLSASIELRGSGPDGPFVVHGRIDSDTSQEARPRRFSIPGFRRR